MFEQSCHPLLVNTLMSKYSHEFTGVYKEKFEFSNPLVIHSTIKSQFLFIQ